MPNLKDIKVRIKSIKSTQKITQAMKLVAASKVRKVQHRLLNQRPYTQSLNEIMDETISALQPADRKEVSLMKAREVKTVGILVISSDRGLCGSYNTNILKTGLKRILELEKEGKEVKLICIGNKANGFFRRTGTEIIDSFTQLPADLTIGLANLITESCKKAFLSGQVDKLEIIGAEFISMLRNENYTRDFLPLVPLPKDPETMEEPKGLKPEVLFEPSVEEVIENLLPIYLSNLIFHLLLEAQCSELASRMNAMSSATTNAKDLIERLTIVYNKARQAAITQEISEIVGGAEALK